MGVTFGRGLSHNSDRNTGVDLVCSIIYYKFQTSKLTLKTNIYQIADRISLESEFDSVIIIFLVNKLLANYHRIYR